MVILKGQPIVPHLAFGLARIKEQRRERRQAAPEFQDPDEEERRFEEALGRLTDRLDQLFEIARTNMEEAEAQIFRMHRHVLEDPMLQKEIRSRIRRCGCSADTAVEAAIDFFCGRYARSNEAKIRAMAAEIMGLREDLLDELEGGDAPVISRTEASIIDFVNEVTPAMVIRAELERVVGFVARSGGQAAHATILARALQIPLVVNVREWREIVREGDRVILDGTTGSVIVNPTEAKDTSYRNLERRLQRTRTRLLANRDLPAITRDGCRIVLQANLVLTAEAEAVERSGAEGVGLFRSELSYLLRNRYPSEEELTEIYRALAERLGDKTLTIRTLDVGGEKTPPYFRLEQGANPLFGLRSLRLLSTHREVLQTQFRALLRVAAQCGNLRVVFPFVATVEEWREVCHAFAEAKQQLRAKGKTLPSNLPLGLMIELPSAAIAARALLKEADFASIGTNDLTQYTLGVDRNEPSVARLYQPLNPAVLELIRRTLEAAKESGKPVSLCGEIAGDPKFTPLLIGLGLRTLSMNPEAIPEVKDRVLHLNASQCEQLTLDVLEEVTAEGALRHINAFESRHFNKSGATARH